MRNLLNVFRLCKALFLGCLSGPQNELISEVQRIALSGQVPDGFAWTLLKLARFADWLFLGGAPILKHLFTNKEYEGAKTRIQDLAEFKIRETERSRGKVDGEFDNLLSNHRS